MTATIADRRGELAAALVPKALELACLVHGDGDQAAIGRFLRKLTDEEFGALPVILAALVPVDQTPAELLSWVTWDEPDEPLKVPRQLVPCGTYGAFRRHEQRGEPIDEPCRMAAREYWAQCNRNRRAAAKSQKEDRNAA